MAILAGLTRRGTRPRTIVRSSMCWRTRQPHSADTRLGHRRATAIALWDCPALNIQRSDKWPKWRHYAENRRTADATTERCAEFPWLAERGKMATSFCGVYPNPVDFHSSRGHPSAVMRPLMTRMTGERPGHAAKGHGVWVMAWKEGESVRPRVINQPGIPPAPSHFGRFGPQPVSTSGWLGSGFAHARVSGRHRPRQRLPSAGGHPYLEPGPDPALSRFFRASDPAVPDLSAAFPAGGAVRACRRDPPGRPRLARGQSVSVPDRGVPSGCRAAVAAGPRMVRAVSPRPQTAAFRHIPVRGSAPGTAGRNDGTGPAAERPPWPPGPQWLCGRLRDPASFRPGPGFRDREPHSDPVAGGRTAG